ncbi:uncharacterized protein LOC107412274 isoform X2 [Ziziphus jujuba]|uniref:Uncharacterized protein LOC107412274 isoform X2 n=1 Tax=Ziziphus jujuba TaxID=326968 RepID=A0A6P3ZPG9_ZIZJJ|nr:uncharacterized protein LOC107412274 isoform X2 [Ziziphus jujuba]
MKAFKALGKPAITAVLLGLLLMYYCPNSAFAASGGRVGGKVFSSRSSSSSSSKSYLSSPSSSSRLLSSSYSSRWLSSSSCSSQCLSDSVCKPSPLGFSGGGDGGVGVDDGSSRSFFMFLMVLAAFALVYRFLSNKFHGSVVTATEKTSVVLKLQVGLSGRARQLQRELNRIADIADTSSPKGLSYVLTETTVALLQHPDDCISGYSAVDLKRSMEDCEERFDQLSVEERGKFDEETLVNVNNIKRQRTSSQGDSGFSNEYIVITILVAAKGVHKLPVIRGSENLKEALQKLGSIPSSRILAVEVLWTPQNENDCLSEQELLEDYPLLRPFWWLIVDVG